MPGDKHGDLAQPRTARRAPSLALSEQGREQDHEGIGHGPATCTTLECRPKASSSSAYCGSSVV